LLTIQTPNFTEKKARDLYVGIAKKQQLKREQKDIINMNDTLICRNCGVINNVKYNALEVDNNFNPIPPPHVELAHVECWKCKEMVYGIRKKKYN